MEFENTARHRLKFFGHQDYGTYFQVEQVGALLAAFDAGQPPTSADDVIELHQAALFIEAQLLPNVLSSEDHARFEGLLPAIRRIVGSYFSQLADVNIADRISEVDYQYHSDLLSLLASGKVFDRCSASVVPPVLEAVHIRCAELVTCHALVRAYDAELKDLILSDSRNAELLVRKELTGAAGSAIKLPTTLTPKDAGALLDRYLESDDVNLNIVELMADAGVLMSIGITAKLKLKARRRLEADTRKLFEGQPGLRFGCEVSISDTQSEESLASLDGAVSKLSYSLTWLTDHLDFPTVLNNFIYLFEFVTHRMIWVMPAYASELGILSALRWQAQRRT